VNDRQQYRDETSHLTAEERQVDNEVVWRHRLEDGDYSVDMLVARRRGTADREPAIVIDIDVIDTDYSSVTIVELTDPQAIDFGRAVLNAVSPPPRVMKSADFAPITE
jgi:hypothetical protein